MAYPDKLAEPLSSPRTRIRVMVVDDSPMMRRLLTDVLDGDPAIEVVGTAQDGVVALKKFPELRPDVITLDVEMPGMDGLSMLRKLKARHPAVRVIMFSSLTERAAPTTVKALMIGANDYLAKPTNFGSLERSRAYLRQELLPKIKLLARRTLGPPRLAPTPIALMPAAGAVQALVIGVSTGGPQALAAILPEFPADFPLPILIVQHMPPNFTRLLAERLATHCRIRVAEASHDRKLECGLALFAAGGYHMTVAKQGNDVVTRLDQTPMENSCRPAVDALFRSAAKVWGGRVIATVLTGMGHDGHKGVEALKPHGAWVLAQDEESSVVWGMPGSIVNAGLADDIQPLERIVPTLLKRIGYSK